MHKLILPLLSLRATATLEAERAAFEAEKKAHYELYEKQQQVHTVWVGETLQVLYRKSGNFRCKNIFLVDGGYEN